LLKAWLTAKTGLSKLRNTDKSNYKLLAPILMLSLTAKFTTVWRVSTPKMTSKL
jgi:hypothetical protein